MGYSLILGARVLAAVYGGKSLNEAWSVLVSEGPGARSAAQEIA